MPHPRDGTLAGCAVLRTGFRGGSDAEDRSAQLCQDSSTGLEQGKTGVVKVPPTDKQNKSCRVIKNIDVI